MPDHLKSIILERSEEFFESSEPASNRLMADNRGGGRLASAVEEYSERARTSFAQWLGWGAAAVACLALAFNLYLTRYQAPDLRADAGNQIIQAPPAELSDAQKFEQLKNSGKAITVAVASADPKKPGAISGDIVWSGAEQKGYMRFRGMPVNDPTATTYQLWIFDEAQDEKYPVDGGVFDINKDGEVIVPIDAKINVRNPKLFAVTKEKPGGVVVSDRKGLIAVAKV
jgi:anti-sigma-K factor RskA